MAIRRTSHAFYDTMHHIVWALKYRKWALRGDVCKTAEEVFLEVMISMDAKLMEMELAKEHVHLFVSIDMKISYDTLAGAIYIELEKRKAAKTREFAPEVSLESRSAAL